MENMEQQVYDACAAGNVAAFLEYVERDPSVLQQMTASCETPLHLASKFKHTDLASEILGQDRSLVTKKDCEGETPLHMACRVGALEIVQRMLVGELSVSSIFNKANKSALFIACEHKHLNVASEICNAMRSLSWDEKGAIAYLHLAGTEGDQDIVKKILDENISLASRKDVDGFSAMHLASKEGKVEVIKRLIEKDSNLSFLRDKDERTPLHSAVITNQLSVVKAFLSPTSLTNAQVADLINTADKDGNTVLHLAAINDNLEVINLLLTERTCLLTKRLIKVNDANNEGMTALDLLEKAQQRATIIKQLTDMKRSYPISQTTMQETSLNNRSSEAEEDASIGAPIEETESAEISEQLESSDRGPDRISETNVQETSPNNIRYSGADEINASIGAPTEETVSAEIVEQSADPRPDPISQTPMQETSLNNVQQALMVVAGLIVTLTFQAGLNPPGGLWQDSEQGNQTNHKAGKAIQSETNLWLFTVFLSSNALGFILSLALIPLIMTLRTNTLRYVNSLVVMALVSVEVAFIIGLIMISDRKPFYHVEIFLLIFVTLAGIVWAIWNKLRS